MTPLTSKFLPSLGTTHAFEISIGSPLTAQPAISTAVAKNKIPVILINAFLLLKRQVFSYQFVRSYLGVIGVDLSDGSCLHDVLRRIHSFEPDSDHSRSLRRFKPKKCVFKNDRIVRFDSEVCSGL